jgi:hypothetical protein
VEVALFTSLFLSDKEERIVVYIIEKLGQTTPAKKAKVLSNFAEQKGLLKLPFYSASQDLFHQAIELLEEPDTNVPRYRMLLLAIFPAIAAIVLLQDIAGSFSTLYFTTSWA